MVVGEQKKLTDLLLVQHKKLGNLKCTQEKVTGLENEVIGLKQEAKEVGEKAVEILNAIFNSYLCTMPIFPFGHGLMGW